MNSLEKSDSAGAASVEVVPQWREHPNFITENMLDIVTPAMRDYYRSGADPDTYGALMSQIAEQCQPLFENIAERLRNPQKQEAAIQDLKVFFDEAVRDSINESSQLMRTSPMYQEIVGMNKGPKTV